MTSAIAITNLLYRYGELMDLGDFSGAAALLAHATVKLSDGREIEGAAMQGIWEQMVIVDAAGRPHTMHVITNPILEIEEAAGTAHCRSCYTVLQGQSDFPLQIIAAGRYHDRFARVDGAWRFSYRDYSMFDLQGDLTRHLRI